MEGESIYQKSSLQGIANRVVVPVPMRQEIAWARMSEAFRDVIREERGPLGGFVTLKGAVDGDVIEVRYGAMGKSIRNHRITGILVPSSEGSQLTLTIENHGFSRAIVTFLVLSLIAGVAAFFAGLNGAPLAAVTALAGTAVGLGIGVVRLAIGFRERNAALQDTADILMRVVCGRPEE